MSCTCKSAGEPCNACDCCVPGGATNITTCYPPDPCDGVYYDLCCVPAPDLPCLIPQPGDTLCTAIVNILEELEDRCNCPCRCYKVTNLSGAVFTRNYFTCLENGDNELVTLTVDNNQTKIVYSCVNIKPNRLPIGVTIEDVSATVQDCSALGQCPECHTFEIVNRTTAPFTRLYTNCEDTDRLPLSITVNPNSRKYVCSCDDILLVTPIQGIEINQIGDDPCDGDPVCVCHFYDITNNTNTDFVRTYTGCNDGGNYAGNVTVPPGKTIRVCGCTDVEFVTPVPGIVIVDTGIVCDSPICDFTFITQVSTTTSTSTTTTSTSTTSTTSTSSTTTTTTKRPLDCTFTFVANISTTTSTSTTSTTSTSTTSTTSTSSSTTTTTTMYFCSCITFTNSSTVTRGVTYTDCNDTVSIEGIVPPLGTLQVCGFDPVVFSTAVTYSIGNPCFNTGGGTYNCTTTSSTTTSSTTTTTTTIPCYCYKIELLNLESLCNTGTYINCAGQQSSFFIDDTKPQKVICAQVGSVVPSCSFPDVLVTGGIRPCNGTVNECSLTCSCIKFTNTTATSYTIHYTNCEYADSTVVVPAISDNGPGQAQVCGSDPIVPPILGLTYEIGQPCEIVIDQQIEPPYHFECPALPCDCITYVYEGLLIDFEGEITYTDCDGNEVTEPVYAGDPPISICGDIASVVVSDLGIAYSNTGDCEPSVLGGYACVVQDLCACITFTNNSLDETTVLIEWDFCPGLFGVSTYALPGRGGTFKACGSNPRIADGLPNPDITWTIGDPCDLTNPYPTCTPTFCYVLTTTATDPFDGCNITYYNAYGEFIEFTSNDGETHYICAQEGSIVVSCGATANTVVLGGITSCIDFEDCQPTTTTTTVGP